MDSARLIDLHQHIIHGVDDGPTDFAHTQAMLRLAAENGVTVIAATSHAMPGLRPFPMDAYQQNLEAARAWIDAEGLPIRLCAGSEIFYTADAPRLLREGRVPTLNGTDRVLVEFSPMESYDTIRDAIRKLGNAGCRVIVAHAERYDALRKAGRIAALRHDLGAYIQINANTVLSPGGFFRKRWLRGLLESGCCDAVASDAHNTQSRPCRMNQAHAALSALLGREAADQMCRFTPARLLGLEQEN